MADNNLKIATQTTDAEVTTVSLFVDAGARYEEGRTVNCQLSSGSEQTKYTCCLEQTENSQIISGIFRAGSLKRKEIGDLEGNFRTYAVKLSIK